MKETRKEKKRKEKIERISYFPWSVSSSALDIGLGIKPLGEKMYSSSFIFTVEFCSLHKFNFFFLKQAEVFV